LRGFANFSNYRQPAFMVTMKKIDFTESQIVKILCEARLTSVNAVASKHNITEATIYAWHNKFGQMDAGEVKRLRHLKNGHARRHRSVAKSGNLESPKELNK
jgi:putative transposase